MTCIIGLEFGNKVYLAGDIQGTGWNNKIVHTQPKVFQRGGAIFGYTSTYRWGQILEHTLKDVIVPEKEEEIYKWLCQKLVPEIIADCKDAGYDDKSHTCLLGIKGQLWEIQDDWSVLRSADGYYAVGSGSEYAMGVMGYALKNNVFKSEKEIKDLLKEAMLIVGTHCPSVGNEAVIISK